MAASVRIRSTGRLRTFSKVMLTTDLAGSRILNLSPCTSSFQKAFDRIIFPVFRIASSVSGQRMGKGQKRRLISYRLKQFV
jgi:hypothetical protein